MPGLSEADTKAKFIDPVLHRKGWTEEHIKREVTAGAIDIINGHPRRRGRGRVDYLLRVKVTAESQPVAVALIEAKAEDLPPEYGLEQAKGYALTKQFNVPFVFSSNGHMFVEYDRLTGHTSDPTALEFFPTPDELRSRYESAVGFSLSDPLAAPLLVRYPGGEAKRRYYQDAAIRAVLEKLARGEKRALLSLATGSGKTFIAVQLLMKLAIAKKLRRALFVCDRDELRTQASAAFQNVFGADAAEVSTKKPRKNDRILIATYQTLDIDNEESTANFLVENYPVDFFSHIVIDECHRSAWGKWSIVLDRNPNAVQIGLTATPRQIKTKEKSADAKTDEAILADNIKHFGEPVYEYDLSQGIEDGYLAACEVVTRDIFLEKKAESERITGLTQDDLGDKTLTEYGTNKQISVTETNGYYSAVKFEDRIVLPDRVKAMSTDLFNQLLTTGGPEQKTIIFCTRDLHADMVAKEMNNLYADWCSRNSRKPRDIYAFKCTAEAELHSRNLDNMKGSSTSHFIAATVDLLTTGVDIPSVKNIVFFKYVKSPISFYQMIGRGTRVDIPSGKLMFRVYDYTNATRLFGEDFFSKAPSRRKSLEEQPPLRPPIQVEGLEVHVTDAGKYIVTEVDGKAKPVTVEEYKERLAARLIEEAGSLEDFRQVWVNPQERRELLAKLPDQGRSPSVIRSLENMEAYDLYDVLAELGYGMSPLKRKERVEAFMYKHDEWLGSMPPATANTLKALAHQFEIGGIEGLETSQVFETAEVKKAGGLNALKILGLPREILLEAKRRIFAA
ncbi:MAG: DEAD/DEAH box helicase family protein [Candidatus Methanomethyliaceae archaeon]